MDHTSEGAKVGKSWYVDSGCSKHMTNTRDILINLQNNTEESVIFGDGVRGKVKGIGKLNIPGMPQLEEVQLVECLTTNLISISQLCDKGMDVQFGCKSCVITDKPNEYLVAKRSVDNCYTVTPPTT